MAAAALIAKAILGGIGGGLKSAGGSSKTNLSGNNSESTRNTAQETGSDIGGLIGKGIKGLINKNKESESSESSETNSNGVSDCKLKKGCSDESLKSLYPDMSDEMIEWFSKINPIKFTYKQEAQELYAGENKGVDDNVHIGVKAQELEKNPVTSGAVETDEHGFKEVDTRHLAFADTAMISELCRKMMEVESKLSKLESLMGVLNGKTY